MQDVVSITSRITFGNNVESFDIPDTLLINPALILDEKEEVYRLSIGAMNDQIAHYEPLFNTLDKHTPFVENIHVYVNDDELTFKLAYVMRKEKPFGIFYDIEAVATDIVFNERKLCEQTKD